MSLHSDTDRTEHCWQLLRKYISNAPTLLEAKNRKKAVNAVRRTNIRHGRARVLIEIKNGAFGHPKGVILKQSAAIGAHGERQADAASRARNAA